MKGKLAKIFLCFALLLTIFPSSNVKAIEKELIINDATVGDGLHQFTFSKGWKTSEGYPDRFYEGDEHWFNFTHYVEGDPLPSYTMKFKGTGFELYGEKQPGLGIYNIYLDGDKIDTADPYNATRLSKVKLYGKTDIPYGDHILKVELARTKNAQSSGTDGEIDYVKVLGVKDDEPEPTTFVSKIEDSSVTDTDELYKFKYTGDWTAGTGNGSIFSNGDEHYAHDGAFYEMKFIGTKIEIWATKNPEHGVYDVTIDGVAAGKANANAPSKIHQQMLFTSQELEDKEHTIKVQLNDQVGKAIQLDFVKVYHSAIAPSAVTLSETDVRLEAGMTRQIKATVSPSIATEKEVEWKSADEDIATVSATGLVSAVSASDSPVKITATVKGTEISAELNVQVITPVEFLSAFVGSTDTLDVQDDYHKLTPLYKNTWSDVAWKGDILNSKIVTCTRGKVVHNAEIIASDFLSGDASISAENIDVKWLKDVLANIGRGTSSAPVKPFPDVIYKGGKLDIAANKVQSAWVTINVPKDAKPGTYTGTIQVKADELEEPYVFNYTFEVLDLVQPKTSETNTQVQFWQHPFSVANYYGIAEKDYFTEEHFKVMRGSMKEYAAMGGKDVVANIVEEAWNHQSYYGDPSMVKWTKKADGTFVFDYKWYDAWINFQIESGTLDPANKVGQIKCYSIVPWGNQIKYYDEASKSYKAEAPSPGSDGWKKLWDSFLKDFMTHSKEKGWFDITYIAMDERGLEDLRAAADMIESVKDENGKSFMISSAFNYNSVTEYDLTDRIHDISIGQTYVSNTDNKMRELTAHRKSRGLITTIYTCTGHYPSNYTISDYGDNTWSMWYTLSHGADGYMRWAWDNYVPDPLTNVTYKWWEPGDGWFIYPVEKNSTDNPDYFYSTPRYEMMKKGIRDVNKAKYLMAQSDEMKEEISAFVQTLQRPTAGGNGYGSAVAASQKDRLMVFSETERIRNGVMDFAREFINGSSVVNKDELKATIEEASKLKESVYTKESWAPFKEALVAAVNVMNNELATQAEVTAAMTALVTTKSNLKEDTTVVKNILKSAIDKANAAEESGQLDKLAPIVKRLIISTRDAAQLVYANANATTAECMDAWMDLADALQYLDFKADKDLLKQLIAECSKIDTSDYKEGVEAFKAALVAAQKVVDNENALQASIDKAWKALDDARSGLIKNDANKLPLEIAINNIVNKVGDGSKYKQDNNYEVFTKALDDANKVMADPDATQAEINAALLALTGAYENIRLLPSEEQLAQLAGFVKAVRSITRNLYTKEQLKEIDGLSAQANNMLADFDEKTFATIEGKLEAALVFIHKVESTNPARPDNGGAGSTSNSASPNTGDVTNMAGILSLLLMSGCGVVWMQRKRNQKCK